MCTKSDVVALMQCCKPKICSYKDGKLTPILSISPSYFKSSFHSIFLSSLSIPTPLSLPLPEITWMHTLIKNCLVSMNCMLILCASFIFCIPCGVIPHLTFSFSCLILVYLIYKIPTASNCTFVYENAFISFACCVPLPYDLLYGLFHLFMKRNWINLFKPESLWKREWAN